MSSKWSTRSGLRSSSLSSVVSTALVLYTLGILTLLLVNVQRLSSYAKERLAISLVLHEGVRPADAEYVRKYLEVAPYTKSATHISRDQAAKELQEALGQDFLELLDYNPLSASVELRLNAPWANNDSITKIVAQLRSLPQLSRVEYESDLVDLVNANVRRIGWALLAFSVVMSFIALVLLSHTMRLSIYARRFTIRTMQLVGATRAYVRRPFLRRAVLQGAIASVLAIGLILYTIWLLRHDFAELVNLQQYRALSLVSAGLWLFGIGLNVVTSYFSVNRYLRISTDALYRQ